MNRAICSARTTPLPTLQELTDLFTVLPEVPIPFPRPRPPQPGQGGSKSTDSTQLNTRVSGTPKVTFSPGSRIWMLVLRFFCSKTDQSSSRSNTGVKPKPNPFVALKAGKKAIIIAAVDMGNISFFKFGQGEFHEWAMV